MELGGWRSQQDRATAKKMGHSGRVSNPFGLIIHLPGCEAEAEESVLGNYCMREKLSKALPQHTRLLQKGGGKKRIQRTNSAINTFAAAFHHVPLPLHSSCQHVSMSMNRPVKAAAYMERQRIRFQERLKPTVKGFSPDKLPVSYSWSTALAAPLCMSNGQTLPSTRYLTSMETKVHFSCDV